MALSYNHIAYAEIEVANPVEQGAIHDLLTRTGLPRGALAIDVGAGVGGVTVAMARDFGLHVHAIERDPILAAMIVDRARSAGVADRIEVAHENSATALARCPAGDLIVALGTTDPVGEGVREPRAVFSRLADRLRSPGFILWGDLVWKGDPPEPLRQVIRLTGDYADDQGWRDAVSGAGLELIAAVQTPQDVWDSYFAGTDARVRAWLLDHADHPDVDALRMRADQIRTTQAFGRPWLGFGLYLMRKA